ncbi:MAG TPA: hypothetical protein VKW06_04355 [Candidatus Angelobacter sp.]|nr:hypothetical protein [Candidatus Angelobacter sp.]
MKSISRFLAAAVILGLFSFPAIRATSPAAVEDQPHMKEALESLKQARHHLEQAVPDKGGHRAAAIKACDEAIKHTQEGIEYANTHHDGDDHDHDKK